MLKLFYVGFASLILINPVDEKEMFCLSQNIYFESRGESYDGRLAVAYVTMNRVESRRFPNTVCEVVWQRRQFSWTQDGKSDWPNTKNKLERKAWKESKIIAKSILSYWQVLQYTDVTNGALYYHNHKVKPVWRAAYNKAAQIGDHVFYN
jgi:spore germination cell wall hydrolase CwlJ-like protein